MKKLLRLLSGLCLITVISLAQVTTFAKDTNQTPTPTPTLNYSFEVISLTLPKQEERDKVINPKITLKNTSNFTWKKSEIKLAYHWIDRNNQIEPFRGETVSLKKDLKPGESIEQPFQIRIAPTAGDFNFSFDLIKGEQWFTYEGNSRFLVPVNVTGKQDLVEDDDYVSHMSINDGAEFANSTNMTINVTAYKHQAENKNSTFVYDYVQATDSTPEEIKNGTAKWSAWRLMSDPWGNSKIQATLSSQSTGIKKVYIRYRAIKKQSDAIPEAYGSTKYNSGRPEKITIAYYADEIFLDNTPPTGSIKINNDQATTLTSKITLNIFATDDLNGIAGSGIEAMRLSANCGLWNEWEPYAATKDNYDLGPGNVLNICAQFRDKAGNISTTYKDSITLITYTPPSPGTGGPIGSGGIGPVLGIGDWIGVGIGSHESPFANLTSNDLAKPSIEFDRTISIFGTDKASKVKGYNLPSPVITYAERDANNTSINVSGIALRKFNPVTVTVNNEYRGGWLLPSSWEWKQEDRTIDNVKVVIYNKTKNVTLGEVWNDASDGRWQINLPLNSNLADGDEISAQAFIYQDFYFDHLHWWSDTFEDDVLFQASHLGSGESSPLKIPPTKSQLLLEKIQSLYNIKLIEDGIAWTEFDLSSIGLGLYYLPKSFYDQGNMQVIKQPTAGNGIQNGCTDFGNGLFVGGYVTATQPNNVYFCALGSATSNNDLSMQGTVIHEFAHNWQRWNSTTDIMYGKNIINNPNHVLYKYYDILFNPVNGEWVLDTSIVNNGGMPSQCSTFGEGRPGNDSTWPIFESRYACQRSLRLNELNPPPQHTMPEEEMAEAIRVYYQYQSYLVTKDNYNYTVNNMTFSGNLNRKSYIEQNIK
jgi:hypothetical protein